MVFEKKDKVIKKYIINISVLTSTIVLIVANLYNEYMDKILRDLIAPIFSADLNNDGQPDLKQLRDLIIKIGGIKNNSRLSVPQAKKTNPYYIRILQIFKNFSDSGA